MEKILNKTELRKKGIANRAMKKKLGEKCVYCNCNNKLILTIDHKIPLIRGGKDIEKNKQVLCIVCNQLKGPLKDREFRAYLDLLNGMKDLCKVKIKLPFQVNVVFNENFYPGSMDGEVKDTEDF